MPLLYIAHPQISDFQLKFSVRLKRDNQPSNNPLFLMALSLFQRVLKLMANSVNPGNTHFWINII